MNRWLIGTGLGVTIFCGHFFYFNKVFNWRYVKAPIVSAAVLGETIGASLLALWLFNEVLTAYQLIGGLAVLAGIILAAAGESGSITDKAS